MKIFGMQIGKAKGESIKTKSSDGAITVDMLGGSSDTITEDKALRLETVFTCIRHKSESIGQLPLKMYRVAKDNTVRPIISGREWRIFTQQPCDYLTLQGVLEMISVSLETKGAFYAYKERNDRGNVMSIIPFRNQDNVRPAMDINGNVYYTYITNDGKIKDPYRVEDLMIVKLFTLDGYTPVSPIKYNAQLLGIAFAQEDSYKELQENGITSQMALATDNVFTDANAIQRLKDDWGDNRGAKGIKKIPLLENGLKPVNLKLTPNDSDLLNHRAFSVNRICRIFREPPELVGVVDSKSSNKPSEINELYMSNGINPILVKIEDAFNALLPDDIRVKFDRKAFYAGSPRQMVESVEREVKAGLASINEGRADLGRDPIEGGDVFAVDNNNVVYGTWDKLEEIQSALYGKPKEINNEE